MLTCKQTTPAATTTTLCNASNDNGHTPQLGVFLILTPHANKHGPGMCTGSAWSMIHNHGYHTFLNLTPHMNNPGWNAHNCHLDFVSNTSLF